MRHAGDGKTFMASAAVAMAGLVIATMLAINAKLQSALSPAGTEAGAPIVKVVPPAPAPVLQSNAPPSVAKSPAAAQLVGTPTSAPAAASVAIVSTPAKAATTAASKTATPAATLTSIKTPVTAALVAAVPQVIVPAITVPPVATPAVTVTIASNSSPASNSDIGDATASSGERHKKTQTVPGSSFTVASSDTTGDATDDTTDDTTNTKDGEHHGEDESGDSSNSHSHSHDGGNGKD